MKYDIVIPHYNAQQVIPAALRCLKTIRLYSKEYRLVWVQNGQPILQDIEEELAQHACVTSILNEENVGFVKAANQGIRCTDARYVVLMNNDTEAAPNWLEKLSAPLEWPIVMSGPRTTTPNSWQGTWPRSHGNYILPKSAMLAFFCTMFDRRVFDLVGLLDEDFGVGFGDDDNYCARVQNANLNLCLVQDLVIPHKHRTTFRALYTQAEVKKMQDDALALYRRKLGQRK